jgi:hypothetical protein
MKKVLHIIDDLAYVTANCYQHMLFQALQRSCDLTTVSLKNLESLSYSTIESFDVIVSCLKLRTIDKYSNVIGNKIGKLPIRIYDQDPWESFKDDSPHKGAYSRISSILNVEFYAVTVRWWAEFMRSRGYPTKFVKIWTRSDYCSNKPSFDQREISVGFIGSIHPHRKDFFDKLSSYGVNVHIEPNQYNYQNFLERLSQIRIFVHSANMQFTVDGEKCNMKHGLWAKEIDACSRGCFCIRESDEDSNSFFSKQQVPAAMFFESIEHAVDIIRNIEKMNVDDRQAMIDSSVNYIKNYPGWFNTAEVLINEKLRNWISLVCEQCQSDGEQHRRCCW